MISRRALGKFKKRKSISNARNKSVDWVLNDSGEHKEVWKGGTDNLSSSRTNHMYVSRSLRTIYSSVVTGSYFLGFPGPKQ